MDVSEIIKTIRTKAGYSQKSFAEELGCTQALISEYELGNAKPGYDILKKMSDFCKKHKIKINLL